jgi:hypothetical protein
MNRRYNAFASGPMAWMIVFGAALFFASTASAVAPTLNPGDTQYNPALNPPNTFFTPSYISGPVPAGYTQLTFQDFPYAYNGTKDESFNGFVRSTVYQASNGTLAFSYVFNNLAPTVPVNPPATDIVRATINDPTNPWGTFAITSAGADPRSGGHSTPIMGFFGGWSNGVPFDVTRSATDFGVAVEFNPLNSGTQLDFPSTNPMSPIGDQSAVIWFATDATKFNITNVGLSDNGHVGTAQAYSPNTVQVPFIPIPGPEPSTLVLVGIGGLGGALAIWRRRQQG